MISLDHSIEEKWQKLWKENHIFEPSINTEMKKFMITVPWPYTNGSLHVGHGKSYTTGDIIARYKRMRGFNVLYPMGFHQSGTPILAYSEKLSMKDPKAMETYHSYLEQYEPASRIDDLIEKFKDPKEIADYFSNATIKDFTAMGYSIDWTRQFTSAEETFQDFVQWQFRVLNEKGYIKQGNYPILYSIRDENAVGEDDILDGDIDKVSIQEFTAIKFRGSDYSLVAASLRPETIFGITNIWINENSKYTLISHGKEKFVVSEQCLDKITRQLEDVEVLRSVEPSEILQREFQVPLTGESKHVFHSDFVNPDNGTGIVYSVPGHSIYDYVALLEGDRIQDLKKVISMEDREMNVENLVKKFRISGLKDVDSLNEATQVLYKEEYYSGRMMDNSGPISGMNVKDARDRIDEILRSSDLAFTFYEVSRKAETRSGSRVIVAVLRDQWFIDYSVEGWKKDAHALVDRMFFFPEFYKSSMHDTVEWLRERPCARRRGIGTRFPFDKKWIIESLSDSTIYPAVYTNAIYLRELKTRLGTIPDSVFDFIFRGKSLQEKYPDEVMTLMTKAKRETEYWYGVDMRMTGIPHFSNHLVFYIMNHAAVLPDKFGPGGISIVGLLISEGAKIGKSKGNAVNLLPVSRRYSADVYRLYIAILADLSSQLDWNEKDLEALIKKYDSFIELLENLERSDEGMSRIENWFTSKFYKRLDSFIRDMDSYSVRSAYVSIFYETMNDLKRLEKRGGNVNSAINAILKDWLISLAAVMPHTCEEYWHRYVKDSFVSLETLEDNYSERVNITLLEQEDYIDSVIEDIRNILTVTGDQPREIAIQVASPETIKFVNSMESGKMKEMDDSLKRHIPDYMKVKKFISIQNFVELELLTESKRYFEKTFSSDVSVSVGSLDVKGKKSWPGRPSIFIKN